MTEKMRLAGLCIFGQAEKSRLAKAKAPAEIRRYEPPEFILAVVTALTVVVFGVEQGILLAAVLSLLQHVRYSYRPNTGVIVRDAAGNWGLEEPVPGKMAEPGLVMFWFGRDLFYANVAFLLSRHADWSMIRPRLFAGWL